MSPLVAGIDIGGTFTDVVLVDVECGSYTRYKLPSTPDDHSRAAISGLEEAIAAAPSAGGKAVDTLRHGTTVATNAVIQRRYAKTGLITNRGFRDVIEIGRQGRPHVYDLDVEKPDPIVPRQLRLEVAGRVGADGLVVEDLSLEDVERAITSLRANNAEAVAICMLHAYVNTSHENTIAEIIRGRLPGIQISTSADIAREFREYERFCTTVLNAALRPIMSSYLMRLSASVQRLNSKTRLEVVRSDGGVMSSRLAATRPTNTFLSGPAAGVVGAAHEAEAVGANRVITFDMGGTSTDVCLVENGKPLIDREQRIRGLPVMVRAVNIFTAGAGGGSIARVENGRILTVGPESAGAVPGPLCYARGGNKATVTDANLVIGRLTANSLVGGRMAIDRTAAIKGITESIASPLGMETTEACGAVLRVTTSNLARAVRTVSIDSGHDPREFTLVAFGGAGPMHAIELALELGMRQVLIPNHPGTTCALGALYGQSSTEFSRTRILALESANATALRRIVSEIEQDVQAWRTAEGLGTAALTTSYVADLRYVGQDFELELALDPKDLESDVGLGQIRNNFHGVHRDRYGYSATDQPIEVVTMRGVAAAAAPSMETERYQWRSDSMAVGYRDVWFVDGGMRRTTVIPRASLAPEEKLVGPAIIEEMDSTTVLPPGVRATVTDSGAILVQL